MSLDPALAKALDQDKAFLENTKIPIITVSGTFREDLKRWHGLPDDDTTPDIVLSRAHFSMALGTMLEAWCKKFDPSEAWIVDPTNFVAHEDWKKIQVTEFVGKTLARHPILKSLKDFVDKFGRNKLPILSSITPPLLHLTKDIKKPILSFHIAAGNILAENGKTVIQVITDPHVRDDYLNNAHRPNMSFCVFDEKTKTEFLEKAALKGIKANPDAVIVTGPPIDPRIIAARHSKNLWSKYPLKLVLTTGGLGTNKPELEKLLTQLLPELRHHTSTLRLVVYTGTQKDIYDMVVKMAKEARVAIESLDEVSAKLRVIYHPQLLDANELLIKYGFPWAQGVITKPSGDMAYDAVAAGCFLLTLKEWGEWEYNIRELFEQKNISRPAVVTNIVKQLKALTDIHQGTCWVHEAMENAQKIDPLFIKGSEHILKAVKKSAA